MLAITAAVYVAAVAVLSVIGRRAAAKEIVLLLPNLLLLFEGLAATHEFHRDRRHFWLWARCGSHRRST